MRLLKLNVDGLRNLSGVQFSLNPHFNLFYGSNGSGKTSLLEAVYLLGRGRSFRTPHLPSVINHHQKTCTVSGLLEAEGGRQVRLGVSRDISGEFSFRVNGVTVKTASSLAVELPLLLINADTFSLLNGGPAQRRAYLDWVVFHVEQGVQTLWKRYQRVLKQRNNLLRRAKIDADLFVPWDRELATLAVDIDRRRDQAAQQLFALIPKVLSVFDEVPEVDFSYYRGWDVGQDLQSVLKANLTSDVKRRATKYGPHSADVKITVKQEGLLAKEVLSRGQQKILVSAMQIARGRLLVETTNRKSVYLLDDLPAELDKQYRLKITQLLKQMDAQVLITGVDTAELLLEEDLAAMQHSLFHVEQGKVVAVEGCANGRTL